MIQMSLEPEKCYESASNHIQNPEPEVKINKNLKKIGSYILGKTLGEGTFGKVKLGIHEPTGEKVAVKILQKSKLADIEDVERVSREIHILKIVQHPHIVQLYEIIETNTALMLIMEYSDGGELFDYIVKHNYVQERQACKFFQQIISGIEYLSQCKVVHRDLKPENMLIDFDKGIKLVDFGLSNTFRKNELLKTACGSPCYAAPEMISGKRYNGTKTDVWSSGVVLFALLAGYLPFEDPNTSVLYSKILSADYELPDYVSQEAADLISKILQTNPDKRITISEIKNHPWFNLVEKSLPDNAGTIVGIDQQPFDSDILQRMEVEHQIQPGYSLKCLESNLHNSVTATYFLLLKKHIKSGGHSVADQRLKTFDKQIFKKHKKIILQFDMKQKKTSTIRIQTRCIAENLKDIHRYKKKNNPTSSNQLLSPNHYLIHQDHTLSSINPIFSPILCSPRSIFYTDSEDHDVFSQEDLATSKIMYLNHKPFLRNKIYERNHHEQERPTLPSSEHCYSPSAYTSQSRKMDGFVFQQDFRPHNYNLNRAIMPSVILQLDQPIHSTQLWQPHLNDHYSLDTMSQYLQANLGLPLKNSDSARGRQYRNYHNSVNTHYRTTR